MKYYRLGFRNNFKFLVRSDVDLDTISKFYSPSRWWAKLALRLCVFRLFNVDAKEIASYKLSGEEAILLMGNDRRNQKYIAYKDKVNVVRKWSVNAGGISKIKKEVGVLLRLKEDVFPFGYPHLLDFNFVDDYAFVDMEYIDSDNPVKCSDEFVRAYFKLIIEKKENSDSLVHGDLTPWNVIESPRGIFIIDWEESRVTDKYYDILYYYYSWYYLGLSKSKESSLELALKRIDRQDLVVNLSVMDEAVKELKLIKNIW